MSIRCMDTVRMYALCVIVHTGYCDIMGDVLGVSTDTNNVISEPVIHGKLGYHSNVSFIYDLLILTPTIAVILYTGRTLTISLDSSLYMSISVWYYHTGSSMWLNI